MSTNRSRRIDRDAAEQLLSGATDARQGGTGALSDLLAAAAAPGTARELAGEEAAVTAFREAARLMPAQSATRTAAPRTKAPRKSTAPQFRRRSMAGCAPARFLSTKIAAAALTATALGGVAVAAGTGNLPVALGGSAGGTPGAHPVPAAPLASTGGSGRPSGTGRGSDRPDNGLAPATAGLAALCRAWTGANGTTGNGQASPDAKFAPLIRAAGNAERVPAFCAKLPQSAGGTATPTPGPTTTAAGPDHDPEHPSDAATDRATGGRTEHPGRPGITLGGKPVHTPGAGAPSASVPGTARPDPGRLDPGGPDIPAPTGDKPDPGRWPQSPTEAGASRPTR
ncbi:hypothetical protein [Kitasatospora mediocidica]|uniref:hypothetical protein n=1 Tax=Kitasatospora mediocidica TaxID=58352 RepID=UPI0006903603|nr:hypothetical protein [Kitasatospora mediocidica]